VVEGGSHGRVGMDENNAPRFDTAHAVFVSENEF